MKFDEAIKQGLSSFWDSVAEGWQHLRHSAANALTRFKPSEQTNLPLKSEIDDMFYMPSTSWSMLGGDVFEDADQIVVRLEVPGLDKNDLSIEVRDDALVVRGEKRFEREESEGRYRVLQCAYGSFQRAVPLPVDVVAEQANASYKNGVLRVALPKARTQAPKSTTIKVD
ncbi:MAG: Hsp20/alpha crystallin family protein [Burkholderiales bacterium]|nr:Hsp20/alpha crystallin family protein [Burkholderiales bacterium]